MRWTQTFIPTLKEAPKDAVVPSHILMLKAGYIRPLGSGAYTYLPLGYRVLRKCEAIVRNEMDKAGAIEIHMPALQPFELWEKTGRNLSMGANMFVVEDRWGAKVALGPTHEEVVTTLAKSVVSSYKQLPVNLYQIQTKFRDEPRPRFGVLRSREFVMKDGYSFNKDLDCLDKSYKEMYAAYQRIFTRAGLRFVTVEAESGPIGGDSSHEFMVPSANGEDTICLVEATGYAANLERCACGPLAKIADEPPAELKTVDTPEQKTIEQIAAFLKLAPNRFIKSLVWVAVDAAGKKTPFMVLVRGDFELNEAKVGKLFKDARVEPADPKTVADVTNAPVGFAGPVGLKPGIAIYVDHSVLSVVNGVTGANAVDKHITGVNPGRDFTPTQVADLRLAAPGDVEVKSGQPLEFKKGIEVGHVFRLGDKYTKPGALDMSYLDEQNNKHTVLMGCYGIGVN
ncbi:MAG: proline--tRNA ligase, partial [Planctomycetota bacterium]